jgi:hypothetical protein
LDKLNKEFHYGEAVFCFVTEEGVNKFAVNPQCVRRCVAVSARMQEREFTSAAV